MTYSNTPSQDQGSRLLRETVYEELRADMISCKLTPGTELREADLAARFEVSKSPVRDALMRLEREGLVITLPRQGYRVAPVSLTDMLDMFHLRAALERACVERIITYASDEQLLSLNSYREFNRENWDRGFVAYNRSFHRHLAELGNNPRMRDQLFDLIDLMERAVQVSLSNATKGDTQVLVNEHCQIIDAIQDRSIKRAQKFAEQHVLAAGKRVRDALAKSLITN